MFKCLKENCEDEREGRTKKKTMRRDKILNSISH